MSLYNINQKYRRGPTLNLGPLSCQGSTRLYWNRALLELEDIHDLSPALKNFLLTKFKDHGAMLEKLRAALQSKHENTSFAKTMDAGMDWVYLFCNLYNTISPFIKPLAMLMPGLGVAWNLFDSIGSAALAAYEGRNGDQWAKKVNYGSALQLSACTGVTIASLCMPASAALGFAGTVTGGFGFAAAMAISWALEKRAVKLCDKRIEYLVNEEIKDNEVSTNYNNWRKEIDSGQSNKLVVQSRQELENSLAALEKNLIIQGNKPEKLLALKMCHRQVKEREMHNRMSKVWKWCTVAMTSVAIVGTIALAVGISAATCGIGLAVGASVIATASAGYRIYQKKKAAKLTLEDGRDRKTKDLNAISDFVSSGKYNQQKDLKSYSEKIKLYKKLSDLKAFSLCADNVYENLFDENLIKQLNEYLDKNKTFNSLQKDYRTKLIPDLLAEFIRSKNNDDPLSNCNLLTQQYSKLLNKEPLDDKLITSDHKMNAYLNEAAIKHIRQYAGKLLSNTLLTPQQQIEKYKRRHHKIFEKQPQMMEFFEYMKKGSGRFRYNVDANEFEAFIKNKPLRQEANFPFYRENIIPKKTQTVSLKK